MRSLIRYVLRCLAFVLMASLLYVALIGIWTMVVPGKLRRNLVLPIGGFVAMQMRDVQTHSRTDVIVLGGSHAYRGYDPRTFQHRGIDLFNLGSSAQTPLQSEVLVEQNLDHLDPELVIIEVYPGYFSSEGVESSLDLIVNGQLDHSIVRMAFDVGNIRTINALIFSIGKKYVGLHSLITNYSYTGDTSQYISNGFVERKSGHFFIPEKEHSLVKWGVKQEQLAAFTRILDRVRHENRNVVLVEAPVTHWYYRSFFNHAEHERLMKSFGPYINMNGMAGLNDSTHFYDPGHMNQQGVEIFNAALLDSLERRGFLPSHPSDQ